MDTNLFYDKVKFVFNFLRSKHRLCHQLERREFKGVKINKTADSKNDLFKKNMQH